MDDGNRRMWGWTRKESDEGELQKRNGNMVLNRENIKSYENKSYKGNI